MDTAHITGWHDFYVVVGTAGATLVGLVYIAVSINVRTFTRHVDDTVLADLFLMTVLLFFALLIIALGFLWSPPQHVAVGGALVGAGLFVGLPARAARRAWDTSPTPLRRYIPKASVHIARAISYVCIVVGVLALFDDPRLDTRGTLGAIVLSCIPIALLLLALFGLVNVWNLLVGLHAVEIAGAEEGEDKGLPLLALPRWLGLSNRVRRRRQRKGQQGRRGNG